MQDYVSIEMHVGECSHTLIPRYNCDKIPKMKPPWINPDRKFGLDKI